MIFYLAGIFLVECIEVASVLKYTTQESLALLDEHGWGISTFDGYNQ